MMFDHIYKGRKVKFYKPSANDIPLDAPDEEKYETGIMHQWFMCGTTIYMPYALIEKKDGSMVLVNYHDVIFEPLPEETDLDDFLVKGFMGGEIKHDDA